MTDAQDNLAKGCLLILVAPLTQVWCRGIYALTGHVIWRWYPPFGVAAPTVPALFALFTLLSLVTTKYPGPSEEPPSKAQAVLFHTLVPLVALASVAIVRWLYS